MLQQGRNVILCKSPWGFRTDPEDRGLTEGWHQAGIPEPSLVTVPHTWNVQKDTEDYRGTGWYEYRFSTQGYGNGQRVWAHFEGVYRDTTVWINGMKAGGHFHSGYTAFRVELTPYLQNSGENLLVVSVDNRNSEFALPRGNHFDWADDGGIIRDVTLIVTGEVAIDYTVIRAVPVFPESAHGDVTGEIEADIVLSEPLSAASSSLDVEICIRQEGETVWSGRQAYTITQGRIKVEGIKLPSVELWHFDHPHLYEMEVSLHQGDIVLDRTNNRFGFREFTAVGSEFRLNREPVRLAGVEWMPGSHPEFGMAEPDEVREQFLTQLKEANCIFTRFHWQQDEKLLDWCDRHGMLIQEEIPLWQQPDEPGEETMERAKAQALEMISRHANHPSIIAWGMGNELNGKSEQTARFMKSLKAYMKDLDSSRLVNYVSHTVHRQPGMDATGVGDVLMWNDYIGTWHGEHDMVEVVERFVSNHPDKPVVVAEFGLCEPAFAGGDPKRIEVLKEKTSFYRKYPAIAGVIFFSLNDYRTQMGEEGEGRLRQRVHGTVDLYGVEKPSYAAFRDEASPVWINLALQEESQTLNCLVGCKNDIPAYSIQEYQLRLQIEGTDQEHSIPISLLPGESKAIQVPIVNLNDGRLLVSVRRPTGFSVVKKTFLFSTNKGLLSEV